MNHDRKDTGQTGQMDMFSKVLLQTIQVQLQLVDELIKLLEIRIDQLQKKLDLDRTTKEIEMERLYERRLEKETSW